MIPRLITGTVVGVVVLSLLAGCGADTFTSIREMERLFDLEQNLVRALDDYLRHADFELQLIQRHYDKLQRIESEIGDVDVYTEHPVNAYSVVRRLLDLWPSTLQLMADSPYFYSPMQLPDAEIVSSMIAAVVKWQEDTQTRTAELAQGGGGGGPLANLTGGDCFGIGVFCYREGKMVLAVEWLEEALEKVKVGQDRDPSASLVDIVEYMFLAKCQAGDIEGSATAYRSLITKKVSKWYSPTEELLKDYHSQPVKDCIAGAIKQAKVTKAAPYFKEYDLTRELCLRPHSRSQDYQSLKCHLERPRSLPLTVKTEELSVPPADTLLLVYEALSHDDILDIKEAALTQLKNLTMAVNGPVLMPNTRTAHSINRRMSTYTELGLELLQGDGRKEVMVVGPGPSRIVTKTDFQQPVLGDVAEGGLSVFSGADRCVSVAPVKGAALVWLVEGHPLQRTECPVMVGAKWVMEQTLRVNTDEEH